MKYRFAFTGLIFFVFSLTAVANSKTPEWVVNPSASSNFAESHCSSRDHSNVESLSFALVDLAYNIMPIQMTVSENSSSKTTSSQMVINGSLGNFIQISSITKSDGDDMSIASTVTFLDEAGKKTEFNLLITGNVKTEQSKATIVKTQSQLSDNEIIDLLLLKETKIKFYTDYAAFEQELYKCTFVSYPANN